MRKNNKLVIYQMFPRLFTNTNVSNTFNGTIEQNGVGKINDIDGKVLESLKDLGVTHMWYTGVIEHATKTDYTQYGIQSGYRAGQGKKKRSFTKATPARLTLFATITTLTPI